MIIFEVRYLVNNSANAFMLETILGALYLHHKHRDSEQVDDENTNNNAALLVHVLRLVQVVRREIIYSTERNYCRKTLRSTIFIFF